MKLYNSKTIEDAESLVFSKSIQSMQELRSFLRERKNKLYEDLDKDQVDSIEQSYYDQVEKWEYIKECLTDNKI